MNRITEITKRDILDLFRNGLEIEVFFDTQTVTYHYFGQLEEMAFLNRLYDLKNMPSNDSRYTNAEEDIIQHTVNNDDWQYCWVFEDKRFPLRNGDDEDYLKFICEVFHPAVRYEKGYWEEFLKKINELLRNDGYELYAEKKISGRDVYDWRTYQPQEEGLFVPYSERNAKEIKLKKIEFSIKRNVRNQIYQILEKYNIEYRKTTETGWNYDTVVSEDVFNDIRQFYVPKCFDKNKQYVETNCLQDFIMSNYPYCVFDAIEFFNKYACSNKFESEINTILQLNDIPFKLENGKIVNAVDIQVEKSSLSPIQEVGLKELIQLAAKYYNEGNLSIAVEKLWDAFERLKTYYSPTLDKKKSVNKIIDTMSGGRPPFMDLFSNEFKELTDIGNKFRIRHHETTKIDIEDDLHYKYFYKRCLSLITTAVQYLDAR